MFVPYLGNLSSLLDRASAHVEARNIDPAVLLNMRLSPTMYSLKQQVGEANRHATVAGALLARRIPHTVSDTEPDIAESVRKRTAEIAIPAESFARAVAFAMSQPEDVDVNEILFRPTRQEL